MYIVIVVGWVVGMAGYIVLNKMNKYNNKNYYDVKPNIQRFKKVRDNVNGVEKKHFK
jgi:hypothetical protein